MVCELEDNSPDELFFRINHTTLRFGIQEFAIITGLNCFANKDDFLFDTSEPNKLINQYFEGKSIIRKAELISKSKNKVWSDGNDNDAIKFAILDAIPENTFQKVGDKDDDKDDDFTSKPPSHKPHNKENGKQKVTVSLSTSIKKFNMHASSSCKEKSPPILHGYRKAKSTPFSSISTPVENNVPVQELHNQPDDSANTTPPKVRNNIKIPRQAKLVTNEFKELRLFVLENFKQIMDAVNKISPQSGAPCQEDGSKSPTYVPNWSNNNSMKDGNQISTFLDKPHFDINEVLCELTCVSNLEVDEHIKDNVPGNYQPTQIHIQDPLSVHEQSNGKQPIGMPSFERVLFIYYTVRVQKTRRLDRWNSSSYLTNFGSSSGPYNYNLFDDYAMWLREGLLNTIDNVFIPVNVEQKNHWVLVVLSIVEQHIYEYNSYRTAGHNSYVRDEIQKLAQLLPMYVSMEIANNSDDTQDQDITYDVTYVEDIPQQGSGDLDCGIYLLAFAEYLSVSEGIPVQYLDSKLHRIIYGALLWQYTAKKMEEVVVSENEAPPRMMRPPARIDNSQLVRID
ncbi:hypothetical protein H5410_007984 [Solanum commersonii]|uniref:Ubiquitin-like protease family profile domain-containing protein n=1 Tax=Solanum commersonii TaxID=4109 RepID=A0A9J6ADL8_SOLCO|nr:hypothetical protein H5410_007984 [Solanum commersonii]